MQFQTTSQLFFFHLFFSELDELKFNSYKKNKNRRMSKKFLKRKMTRTTYSSKLRAIGMGPKTSNDENNPIIYWVLTMKPCPVTLRFTSHNWEVELLLWQYSHFTYGEDHWKNIVTKVVQRISYKRIPGKGEARNKPKNVWEFST